MPQLHGKHMVNGGKPCVDSSMHRWPLVGEENMAIPVTMHHEANPLTKHSITMKLPNLSGLFHHIAGLIVPINLKVVGDKEGDTLYPGIRLKLPANALNIGIVYTRSRYHPNEKNTGICRK